MVDTVCVINTRNYAWTTVCQARLVLGVDGIST